MTSRSFADDYAWQLQFEPHVREIVTEAFGVGEFDVTFTKPDSDDDRRFNTDILVRINGRVRRISQRIRHYIVADEFTLRRTRPTTPTEWQKMRAGFGDYFLYGRGIDRTGRLESWFVGDLDVFKDWVDSYTTAGREPPFIEKANKDGSSTFVAFSRSDLPPEFTIAEDPEAELRDAWWSIVRDGKGMSAAGHSSVVRWARAGLGFDGWEPGGKRREA